MKQDWFEYLIIMLLIAGGIYGQLALATCQVPKAPYTTTLIVLLVVIAVVVSLRRILKFESPLHRPTSDPEEAGSGIKQ